jgi:hypothetical protein
LVVRKLAGIALAAGVLFSVAGCSFNPNPESLQSYAPSDGVGADIVFDKAQRNESVKLRNFVVITDGSSYNLFGTVINDGVSTQQITLQLASDRSQSQTVEVAKHSTLVFNTENPTTLTLSGKPGGLVKVYVGTAAGDNWQVISVPVLDGTLSYYQNLVGTPSETPAN